MDPAPPSEIACCNNDDLHITGSSEPVLMLERDVHAHPQWGPWASRLFDTYKNEGSASRGIAHIAPNLFIGASRAGFFHYSRHRKVILVYAYTGPDADFDRLAGELLAYCDRRGYQLNFLFQRRLTEVAGVAFTATPFGVVQRVVRLSEFTLKGGAMHRLRYQVTSFQKAGHCTFEEYRCGSDLDVARDIARVIDAWCAGKTKVNPLVKTARAEILDGTLHERHRLFLTRVDGVLQNVVLISPLSERDNGYLMDLEFYGSDMPRGGLEFAIVKIIEKLVAEGRAVLSLGGTYGCRIEQSPNADPGIEALLDDLHKQNIFNDQGNFQFKNKFRPENQTIYLCRRADDKQAGTTIDIIMMIADPSRSQTADTENHTGPAAIEAAPPPACPEASALVALADMPPIPALRCLADASFNPLRLADEHVRFDLKTDSWAQVDPPAKAARMHALRAGLQQPIDFEAVLSGVFPFPRFVLTESGRTAEQAFFRGFGRRGLVVQNILFPTNLAHQITAGFSPREFPHEHFADASRQTVDRAGIDLARLEALLAKDPAKIALVLVELANNASGGASVPIDHLRQIKAQLAPHGIPLVMDATRCLENVRLAQRAGYRPDADPWLLLREWLQLADAAIFSLAKDFALDRGGIVAVRDARLADAIEQAAAKEGTGLSLLDRKLVALAMRERHDLIASVDRRIDAVERLAGVLERHKVPMVAPAGGHCLVVDAGRLAGFRGLPEPAASFCAWLQLATGIRGGRHSVGMQRAASVRELVRLAIPVGLDSHAVDAIAEELDAAFTRVANVPVLRRENTPLGGFGEAAACYEIEGFQAVDAQAWRVSSGLDAQAPAADVQTPSDSGKDQPAAGSDTPRMQARSTMPIAIVGLAGRYPKARNIRELWENLRQGLDCIEELPADRYQRRLRYGPAKRYRGGFIDDVDRFDSLFFQIPPKDAERLDPQERLFVEVAWEALEDAGYYPEAIAGSKSGRVGVYVGAVWAMYQSLGVEERHLGSDQAPSSFLWGIANRVSYAMNFSGPSLTVDTACSSSLTALYLACEAIRTGECHSALVGGVNLDLHQSKWDINWSGGALSKDGVCRSFGQGANGYVAGEGVGAIYIKPLDQALADGDQIYGVIRGIAVNHGGRTSGFVVPNPKAQAELVRLALERARLEPADIGYIEAHGTGTELGDPLEISALNSAFRGAPIAPGSCPVGSLKSNIGHLEAAAGVAGITKVLLQMRHRQLVPSLHSSVLNEHIDFEGSPFRIQQVSEPWHPLSRDGVAQPLRAGISSFGAGGANAHVVIESHEPPPTEPGDATRLHVFPISARTEAQRADAARNLRDFLAAHGNVAVADIAHTLQVGRKPFEHRLAVVARSTEELVARLDIFLKGARHASVVVGNGKAADPVLRAMNRAERNEVMALLGGRADAAKLARLWVDGMIQDWHGLPAAAHGRRVSLPTYPFADKRHWIPESAVATSPGMGAPVLHPLLDGNESTFERQLFRKRFHNGEFFIYDHKVMDIPTLPGVAYLELARKAGELAAGMPVRTIRNILWVSPVAVREQPHEVRVELMPASDGVSFEVFSEGADGQRVLHSQGKLTYLAGGAAPYEGDVVDIAAVKARCRLVAQGEAVYPRFRELGLDLGPSFRSLQEVYRGEGEALGLLQLPADRRRDLADMLLHPSLVDGALQAGVAAELATGDARMLVPFSIGEVEILGALEETCWTWVTEVVDERAVRSTVSRKNVTLLAPDGRVLVRIREATGVPIGELHKTADGGDPEVGTHVYVPRWTPAPVDALPSSPRPGAMLLIGAERELQDALAAHRPDGLVIVDPGESFAILGANRYAARLDDTEDMSRVLAELDDRHVDLAGVVLAGSPDARNDVVARVFGTCQALAKRRFEKKLRLIYAFTRKEGDARPYDQAVVGLFRSLHLENGKIGGVVVERVDEATDSGRLAQSVDAEWHAPGDDGAWVRYADAERQVERLTAIDMSSAASGGSGPREEGTYLISGGAGGLGLIFADWLARTFRARLVLSGRSPMSPELESRLDALRERGAEVLYVQADVSRREDAERWVNEARQRFGAIHGVLHAAGILRDAHLRNMPRLDFDAVLAPKLDGTLHLDELTADDRLDFFAMCSSMAALGGNAGQTAYAYANHFMDCFAQAREARRVRGERHGRTLSVNWSLWADGGMRVDAATERMFLETLGMVPIPTAAGVAAFAQALQGEHVQVAVIEGVREKIEAAWGLRKRPKPVQAAASSAATQGDIEQLESVVRAKLRQIAMGFLKLDEEDIATDSVLLELGFDSIGLTSYANSINETYGVEITPVLFFDYPSIADVAGYLCRECASHVAAVHDRATDHSAPAPAAATSGSAKEPTFRKPGLPAQATGPASGANRGNRFVDMPIAIVGMAGVMPESDDLEAFWQHLERGDDLIRVIPRDRWNWEDYYGDPFKETNKSNSKWGGFLNEVDKFDPLFFGISRREAQMMDPQQRIFLETVWKAVEDAGHKVSDLAGTRTGLFVGVATNDYVDLLTRHNIDVDGYSASGNSHSVLANRISFLLNLRGPSAPIDTACSSSLVALHRAIESIHTGSCDMAIVGGVQVMLSPGAYISFGMAGMLSNDGRCKTFDKRADGYVRGEGAGAILIKPLARAEADGDHIYAVVRATAENHGGRVTTLTAPNSAAQTELLVDAYTKAEVDPSMVGYIECHGTGTSLGDPIEIQALKKAFAELYAQRDLPAPPEPHCGLSSAKTNIGHLETAAGIAGILRALLSIRHRRIPANVHFEEVNPYIDLRGTPFYIAQGTRDWPAPVDSQGRTGTRLAGVSSFGFGGANAHVVLEEYASPATSPSRSARDKVFPLSARDDQRLRAYVERMLEHLERHQDVDLARMAYTLQVGRDAMPSRLAVVAEDRQALVDAWRDFLEGRQAGAAWHGTVNAGQRGDRLEGEAAADATAVARAWAAGGEVDWSALHPQARPRRMPLPTYPFARERCWLPGVEGFQREVPHAPAGAAIRLPLPARTRPTDAAPVENGALIARPRWHALEPLSPVIDSTIARQILLVGAVAALALPESRDIAVARLDVAANQGGHLFYDALASACFERVRAWGVAPVLFQVVVDDHAGTLASGLAGMFRSIGHERPACRVQLVIVPSGASADAVVSWLDAAAGRPHEALLRVGPEGRLQRQRWDILPLAGEDASFAFREHGVYLITGGLGGLGRIFARDILARTRHAHVVLGGRGTPEGVRKRQFDDLHALAPGRVSWISLDLSDRDGVRLAIRALVASHGGLHGVVHAAGMAIDNALQRKSLDEFRRVLAPKVAGTVHLDEATRELGLDFFIPFSSVVAALGNVGQADYAAANGFLEAYSTWRRSTGDSAWRAIAWPLWDEGGMQPPVAIRESVQAMTGMRPLATAKGLELFHACLESGWEVCLVMQGDTVKFSRILDAGMQPPQAAARADNLGRPVSNGAVQGLRTGLLKLVSDTLLVPAGEIDTRRNLSEYGLDSIGVAGLFRAIRETFGLDLPASTIFEHPTLDALSMLLTDMLAGDPKALGDAAHSIHPDEQATPTAPARSEAGAVARSEPAVAIVGMAGMFPGADDPDMLWQNLVNEKDAIAAVPRGRWADAALEPSWRQGGFLAAVDRFDAAFFGIGAEEAALMDPQQRLFLQVAWHAIEHAGHSPSSLAGTRTGVFVGVGGFDYAEILRGSELAGSGHAVTGMAHCVVANRLSHQLDLRGPSEAIDTACSASLVAIHRASEAIASGACDQAIAGGVNLLLSPSLQSSLADAGALSASGRCQVFDERADGYVRGEGCAAVMLKRLDRALRDGDDVLAVLKGSGVAHGGRSMSLTAPNPKAQAELLVDVYARAGVDPALVGLIETHGTGTPLGDAVEVNGLKKAFAELRDRHGRRTEGMQCTLGALKSHIGHLEAASGVASLIAAVLAIRHRTLPGVLHYERPNPQVRLEDTGLRIGRRAQAWEAALDAHGGQQPLTAGVSAFGFGGVNAHAIVQEYRGERSATQAGGMAEPLQRMIVLSARTATQLEQQVQNLLAFLRGPAGAKATLADLAYTLQAGRDAMEERLGLLVDSREHLERQLDALATGLAVQFGMYRSRVERSSESVRLLDRDPALKETIITKWLAAGELGPLLEFWCKGVDIAWERLYAGSRLNRIALPGYPFATERHWVDTLGGRPNAAPATVVVAAAGRDAEASAEALIRAEVASQLSVAPHSLDPERNFFELGVTSLGLAQLVREVNARLGVDLSPSMLFEYPTIRTLASHLDTVVASAMAPARAAVGVPESLPAPSEGSPEDPMALFEEILWKGGGEGEYERLTF